MIVLSQNSVLIESIEIYAINGIKVAGVVHDMRVLINNFTGCGNPY